MKTCQECKKYEVSCPGTPTGKIPGYCFKIKGKSPQTSEAVVPLNDLLAGERFDKFKDLLTTYGNTSFDCGAWDEYDAEKYKTIEELNSKARQEIIDFIQTS